MTTLFCISKEDKAYVSRLQSAKFLVDSDLTSLKAIIRSNPDINSVVVSDPALIFSLYPGDKASQDDLAGSLATLEGKELLIINPLKQTQTTTTGKFIQDRFLSKILNRSAWPQDYKALSKHDFILVTQQNYQLILNQARQSAKLIAIDIETIRENLRIDCIAYSILFTSGGIKTYVLEISSRFSLDIAREFNSLEQPKIFHNGQYDNSYFIRWSIPPVNWLFDTQILFHCWYSELPKSLAFVSSFMLRNNFYWKSLAKTGSREEYLFYNAKDSYTTLLCFLELVKSLPRWAIDNYRIEFPLVFPALKCGLQGLKVNQDSINSLKSSKEKELLEIDASLKKMCGGKPLNPNSYKQVLSILKILGMPAESSDEKSLNKVKFKNKFAGLFVDKILKRRELKKAIGTYLEFELLCGRALFSLRTDGTKTGRMASSSSAFWCGTNIQNQPQYVKSIYEADAGFKFYEYDFSQSEARCVAYLAKDKEFIASIEAKGDFYTKIASKLFSIPTEEVTKDHRNLYTKRIVHGANYNMAERVFIETFGLENIYKAKKHLNLVGYSPEQVASHLLQLYHNFCPALKGKWYPSLKESIKLFGKLTGPTGWTRKFFGNPEESKSVLNELIAHGPQSLSVCIINQAFLRMYKELEGDNFRLCAQIHDSILFQIRDGFEGEYLPKVEDIMTIPTQVYDNILTIPVEGKGPGLTWADLK